MKENYDQLKVGMELNLKEMVGLKAASYVKDGMTVGLGTGSTAYYMIEELGRRVKEEGLDRAEHRGFIAGADWADSNPVLPWISVEDDLPYKHSDLVYPLTGGSIEITQVVIVKDSNGDIGLSSMCGEDGNWEWATKGDWKYWMPVSALKIFNKYK